jgi:anti-anti-sigma factor
MGMAISKQFQSNENVWVIRPSGYLDLFNLPEVREALCGTEGRDILFCCEELRYLDSAVIKLLAEVAAARRAEGHVFQMRGLKPYIYKIIEMVGLQQVFVFENGEEGQA